jgi:DNA primase
MASEEGRARFVAEARPLLGQVEAPALAALLRRRLAELARLDATEIEALVPSKLAVAPAGRPGGPRSPAPRAVRQPPASPESRLLGRLLLRPDLAAQVPDEALEGSRPGAAVLKEVVAFCRANPHVTLGQVSAHFEGSEFAGPIEDALAEPLLAQAEELDLEAEVSHWVAELREEKLARRQGELVRLLEAGTATPEQLAEYKALYARLEAARSGNPPTGIRSKL